LFSRPLSFVAGPVTGRQTVAYALQEPFRSIAGPIVKVSKRYYWFTDYLKLLRGLLNYMCPSRNCEFRPWPAAVVISELGLDYTVFRDENHFVPYLRLAPNLSISGGKKVPKKSKATTEI
jgi:hypothetical protein